MVGKKKIELIKFSHHATNAATTNLFNSRYIAMYELVHVPEHVFLLFFSERVVSGSGHDQQLAVIAAFDFQHIAAEMTHLFVRD